MKNSILSPPGGPLLPDGSKRGGWWHQDQAENRIVCDLCPRECRLKDGDCGFCFVRENRGGEMLLTTYGRSTGFCIDPIEKKPLNHFFPGTSVLSFGTAGCNLGCKFCQNHDISKAREVSLLSQRALPDAIAAAALAHGCHSVAYTYNDPVVWAEYAIDTARACRERGIKNVAVTAGYITAAARRPFFEWFDAANVDLKGFSEEFYQQLTLSHLQPVLDTLQWLKQETDCWFEITNLIIPRANDDPGEIRRMCDWILQTIGPDHPVHFTAFHPDFRLLDRPPTPHETLIMAYQLAREAGLRYVYVGNVDDVQRQSTYCPHCGLQLVERNWYTLGTYQLRGNCCAGCHHEIPGRFGDAPGNWGRRRQPVDMSRFASSSPPIAHDSRSAPSQSEQPANQPKEPAMATAPVLVGQTEEGHRAIHRYACEVVTATVQRREIASSLVLSAELAEMTVHGAYVSLKREGRLRGCCGSIGRPQGLAAAIADAGRRTALEDPRFPPVSVAELPYLELETWLLGPAQPVPQTGASVAESIEIGKHGLHIRRGANRGLLLPGVAVEHGLDAVGFLEQVCVKAKLPRDAWREPDTELATFEGTSWRAPLAVGMDHASCEQPMLSDDDVRQLQQWVAENIYSFWRGATPTFYLPHVQDALVQLAAVLVVDPRGKSVGTAFRCSWRPPMPVQATLFQLAQEIAESIQRQGEMPESGWRAELILGHDAALHGTLRNTDLRGFDAKRRALMATQTDRIAMAYQPSDEPQAALKQLLVLLGSGHDEASVHDELLSLGVVASSSPLSFSNTSRADARRAPRAAAVAGRFYPASVEQMQGQIAQLFHGAATPERGRVAAAMVPHAGWQYSGRIAAEVLARIELPETVVILGPKHTRAGVDYAVAPCTSWQIPGGELLADEFLAERLAEQVPQWQLDAAAHAQEHAVEVELPLLAYVKPDVRVVGIALGPASFPQCERFAEALADVLRDRLDRVLLLISSDMNHFANDVQNRRLDTIALEALETCDPAFAFRRIQEQRISMCGLVPATVVMLALHRLDRLHHAQRVAYATSADVSGDTSRVVGYAGMLFNAR